MEEMTYNKAMAELEQIIARMESDSCDIDKLSAYTTRAMQLLKFCKERLFKTNQEVEECLKALRDTLPDTEA